VWVAQPGDRSHGIHEAMGSIPIRSTNSGHNLAAPPQAKTPPRRVYSGQGTREEIPAL
jgi:hypothetical protein